MNNIEQRKQLITLYYDKLRLSQQREVLLELNGNKLANIANDRVWNYEIKFFELPVEDIKRVLNKYL